MLSTFGLEILKNLDLGIITAYIVSFTILVASIIALTKDDLKARLAYSTVSQLSYIVLGVALLDRIRSDRWYPPHRQPRFQQNYPLLLRGRHLCGNQQKEDQ